MSALLNLDLAQDILGQIEEHPESHYQGHWINNPMEFPVYETFDCDTTACIAGWAVLLNTSGWMADYPTGLVLDPEGNRYDFPVAGKVLLGLTDEQASDIFYANETDARLALRQAVRDAQAADKPVDEEVVAA